MNTQQAADPWEVRRLVFLFGLAYFAEGLSQAGGLIGQPLNFYMKEGLGFTTAQVADYLAILSIPWMIKPVYGLVSDYIPLLGYRRKTWLMVVNLCAASGFLWLSGLNDSGTLIVALTLTAFGTASSDVIIDALMVENGERTGLTARFQGVQWFWFKISAIVTALLGGYLASTFKPATALHMAATITMFAPIAVMTAGYLFIREERSEISLDKARETTRSVIEAFKTPGLQAAAAFLALWCFSPAFGTPLYYHMVDHLHFDQQFIGQLGAMTALGGVFGAFLFMRYFSRKSIAFRAVFSVFAAVAGVMVYTLLVQPHDYSAAIARPLHVFVGLVSQIGMLTVLTMAAEACPPQAAGFAFAALMSIYNGVEQFSAIIGSRLYNDVFQQSFEPLLWVAAASFMCCLALVPWLRRVESSLEPLAVHDEA